MRINKEYLRCLYEQAISRTYEYNSFYEDNSVGIEKGFFDVKLKLGCLEKAMNASNNAIEIYFSYCNKN